MSQKFSRRDFLKLLSAGSLSWAAPRFLFQAADQSASSPRPNVVIVVFDAFSAHNISLYGYPRQTTPNLDRLVEKAVVFHNHYANGNFTTPGTASLLTGTLPWTHQAFNHNDTVAESYVGNNIFQAFRGYHRLAYSHNLLVNTLLKQFRSQIDDYTPEGKLFLEDDVFLHSAFSNDEDIATVAWTRIIKQSIDGISYSLLAPRVYESLKQGHAEDLKANFPRGLPNVSQDSYFILEEGIDWLQNRIQSAPHPFLSYYHYLPPHFPYKTRQEFYGRFAQDDYHHPKKPQHFFATDDLTEADLAERRAWYDEYILYVDAEFARLHDFMEQQGLLENTWLVFTSDHGEMFERGISGHQKPVLYEPVVRIPLVIFEPGRTSRLDVTQRTSSVDLLPTLASVTGGELPAWTEGDLLPPYVSAAQNSPRDIYAIESRSTGKGEPVLQATAMIIRQNYKLIRYWGYEQFESEIIELYDLENDPQEMNNLATEEEEKVSELLTALKNKLTEAERHNQRS